MTNRGEVLDQKAEEIRALLAEWAPQALNLTLGERVVFSLELMASPIVERSKGLNELLEMDLKEYFTEERARNAGMELKIYFARTATSIAWKPAHLREYIKNNSNHNLPPRLVGSMGLTKIWTVRDLVMVGRHRIAKWDNVGKKTMECLEKVLAHDGIRLNP